jgi:hypothetical protein
MSVAGVASNSAILFSDGDTLNSSVSNLLSKDKNLQSVRVIGGSKILGVKGSLYNGNLSLFYIDDVNTIPELEKKEGFLENFTGVAVASDTIFPDALSGSALAAKLGYKLVLSDGNNFNYSVESHQNVLSSGLILGGTGVISDNLPGKISAIFNKNIPANPNGLKDTDEVPFTDENLKKDIEKYLGKTNITLADAKKINLLDLEQDSNKGGYQISDFKDIKYFPNLSAMIIRNGVFPTKNLDIFNSLYDFKGDFGGFSLVNCKYNDSDFNVLNKDIVVIKNSK